MTLGWVSLALVYLLVLFYIASWGDKNSPAARKLTSHPAIYSLALAIYCTAWTFFGAVGQASRDTWSYLPLLLGPILVYLLGYRFIYKLTLVSKKQHITTIADFIASRYGKRQTVALLVTVIALLATVPYIALQLKAIGSTFQLLTRQSDSNMIVLAATVFIAIFAIFFGTKQADVTEYRRGLMLAIAFESSIKLLALVLVAIVGYSVWTTTESGSLLGRYTTSEALSQFGSLTFIAQTVMSAAAVLCLPRQFHVAIVDNLSLSHLKTARWLFPLYLAILAAVIPVIATAGTAIFGASVEPDTYVISLAIYSESVLLQMLVFIGGLSAATAMIIVATLTLSTMLTNDVILPSWLARGSPANRNKDYARQIQRIRRVVIGLILLMAFVYHQQMTGARSLHSIGLVAFSLVIQLLPAIVGGLYWRRAHAHGVYAGLLVGVTCWILWLVVPLATAPAGSVAQSDTISAGALFSLTANITAFVLFSWLASHRLIDRIQAEAFVAPSDTNNQAAATSAQSAITIADLTTLLTTFMGASRCQQLVNEYQYLNTCTLIETEQPDDAFLAFCERALGGVLGASSAKALLDSVLQGKKLDVTEVINFFDGTTQAVKFNMSALLTSLENMDQGISVVDQHLNLVAWNKQYATLYQYPEALLTVGTPIEKLIRYNAEKGEFGPGDIEEQVDKRLAYLRSGSPHRFTRQRSDGRVIEMVGNPLPGGGFVTSFNDITAHVEIQQALEESNIDLELRVKKRTEEVHSINAELRLEIERRSEAEKELIRARQAAEDANASKTRFLALASHDVLQPLNAAKLYLSALQEAGLPEQAASIVTKLNHSVNSSEALIATLLDIARLDQGEMKPSLEPVNVADLLGPLAEEMALSAQDKGLQLRIRLRSCWVTTDKTFLYRITQNLLSNAIKYTPTGKVLFTARRRAGQVELAVYDTGIGISEEQQALIFGDFYRTLESTEHGVGLGLAVVRRLSSQLGAAIKVTSTPGQGSCFSLNLPTTHSPAAGGDTTRPRTGDFTGLRVLCVDDQQQNLDAMQTLLQKWGAEVCVADSRQQALETAREFAPQVLLMDYHLGHGDNGLALIDTLRDAYDALLPAALITANQEEDLRDRCKAQSVHYLAKPLKPARLRALLQQMQREAKTFE
ncbi:hybrid sensor histidine kinase/response regulator [Alteromonas sp. ASW11-19]|uniref:histidine kinase n=1 Tax=Alteromonas salexigens TaxID=2982530 RepID=A0ABT2VK90_9ALTE|nr:PAS domain-containing hybrid sensor histidine kinase/response regulator [Alteromonas salexigens]MCU7553683.1 hybrid sensor histidine kinase/response regulator [Alteromonas salexigens]